ncbi:MAG: SEL1-like repeat protein [Methylobacteriaceae bacterium]|jgi:TPR repeat protein|nr:SEL1-like repeat protein [Methylobacteriaceae bacterium]
MKTPQPPSETDEVKWCRMAAERGDALSQFKLGEFYETGRGVAVDREAAGNWYRKAAAQGVPGAEAAVKRMKKSGGSFSVARVVILVLAFLIIRFLITGVNSELDRLDDAKVAQALEESIKAAKTGDAKAQHELGQIYYDGRDARRKYYQLPNYVEAANWFRKSAEQGYAPAQVSLGYVFLNGEGVKKDATEAVKWFRRAAEQGSADAEMWMGSAYHHGEGVPQDDVEAVKWYHRAAAHGSRNGEYMLGYMYGTGAGVPKDEAEALKWYHLSAEHGHYDAQRALERLYPEKK